MKMKEEPCNLINYTYVGSGHDSQLVLNSLVYFSIVHHTVLSGVIYTAVCLSTVIAVLC